MDITTLYNMAKAASEAATNAANVRTNPANSPDYFPYGVYPAYVQQYNKLLSLAHLVCGEEAKALFQPIDLGNQMDPKNTLGIYWKTYLDMAVVHLAELVAYLQSKIPTVQKDVEAMLDYINANLRLSTYEDPQREKEVQNTIETLLRGRNYDFRREVVRIPYSAKTFIPDFTIEDLSLVVEAKLCDSDKRVKEMVDEINADIPAYQTRYKHLIFVIYDLGFIRDVTQFKGSIEKNLNVHVTIIKK